jgi:glycosyltransferase involved in cell wall biosynthesis
MKLNWFSPLPPAKTGIAHYTAKLLPALTARAEVTLWTDQVEWDPGLETDASVRSYRLAEISWREVHEGNLSIYHLGNNYQFHGTIWQVSRRHPGIVILHDPCLQDFFAAVYKATGNHQEYLAHMARYYGREGFQAAERFLAGTVGTDLLAQHYPLSPLALENALGVLVHNHQARADLQVRNRWPVAVAHLPFPATSAASLATTMHKYWQGPPFRLIIFGYIGQNRRLDSVLEALAGFPGRQQFRLEVYGELWGRDQVQDRIRALGLQDLVHLHGFVRDDTLDAALASAHLAINLRFPSMGEASESQLRLWNHCLPTLVTAVGWYASLPHTAVDFVRPEHEIHDLRAHLQAFLANPARFAAKGHHGRRLLEQRHSPEAYASAILEFAAEVQRFRPRSVAHLLVERAATEMSGWTNPLLGDQGSPKVAEEIFGMVA